MITLQKTSNTRKYLALFVAVTMVMAMMCSSFAFAAGDAASATNELTNGITGGLEQAYSIIKTIAIPVGVIGFVVCGVKMLWGNQKSAEEGKSALIRIILAMGIIFIGPLIVKTIAGWFGQFNVSGTTQAAAPAASIPPTT